MKSMMDDAETCAMLAITPIMLKELRARREIPFVKLGHRTVRYLHSDVEAYLLRKRSPAVWEKAR
jgi:predicted DNA-binding transcriptional regulator AlpA